LEEPPERVVRDVEGEQSRRAEAIEAVEHEQQADAGQVVDELVEEGRLEGGVALVAGDPVLEVDLQAPGPAGRLAVELLVEPVPHAADPLRQYYPRRDRVHEVTHPRARAPQPHGISQTAGAYP